MLYRKTFDDANEPAKHWMMTGLGMKWLEEVEGEDSLRLPAVDERMRMALVQLTEKLKKEGKKIYGYDYAWIYYLTVKDKGNTMPVFNSISSFRDYLLQIGITQVCKKSTLSEYFGKVSGTFPDWTFKDSPKPCDDNERLRRINIARRFLVIYRRCLAVAA